jgi:hypothetical protein
MERVNITIGPLAFDHAEGHVIRYAPGTHRIVGLTMMGPRQILTRDGHLTITIPETVETTAETLAPALAAI